MWHSARRRAKKQNVPFDITIDDIIIPNYCPVLGIPLFQGSKDEMYNSPSLDKIIPELGYVKCNIAVISHRANTIKNNGTAEEHRKIAQWLDSITKA
jgi:hypothetical protein